MRMRHLLGGVWVLVFCLAAFAAARQDEEPRDVGLTEEAGRRLAQLDVTIRGPRDVVSGLTLDDFELLIRGEQIEDFFIDRVCRDTGDEPAAAEVAEAAEPDRDSPATGIETTTVPSHVAPASYLFYFDQAFLTMEGRVQSLEIAADLLRVLIRNGNQAMVVSSGEMLTTYTGLTDDLDELLSALDRIDEDPRQWDPTAMSEESKIQEVLDAMNPDVDRSASTTKALGVARRYQREEAFLTERSLQRLRMVLGRMIDLTPPKATIYFADRMRSRPGEHYLDLFSSSQRETSANASAMELSSYSAMNSFDGVTREANTHGIRFYSVQAEGLTTLTGLRGSGGSAAARTTHIRAAQDSLVGLSLETGGHAFLNGVKASKIARRIEEDLACLYLVSFDPSGFVEDRALAVRVRLRPPKLKVQHRGMIVFPSESTRRTTRLMAGFASPNLTQNEIEIRGTVIPTGFVDGKYSALVQVKVPGSPMAGARWDLGASLVSRGQLRADDSRRVEVATPGTPVVLETEMIFRPGPFELVMVAHETRSDQVISGQLDGEWPNPNDAPATVGPIAVMQPVSAAFVRGERVRGHGAMGFGDLEAVDTSRPTAMVSLVCRARGNKGKLLVRRRLVGESAASFEDLDLDLGKDRCAQIRDMIAADTMTEGTFEYEVRVLGKGQELALGTRFFAAVSPTRNASAGF